MRIIVPMAGRGSRLRPHTLTTPKPLIKVVGKPIVQRLVEDLSKMANGHSIEEIAFVIGDFGAEVENQLVSIAENMGAKGTIYYQEEPLGTAHAIYCAHDSLKGPVIVAFADTLFKADFEIKDYYDAMIYVQKVNNPAAFGVVKINDEGLISDFVEKPEEFISDLAIIGIYYFSQGEYLKKHLKHLLDNKLIVGGEYQLTTALTNMRNEGAKMVPGQVEKWLDCGNKDITVQTNGQYMDLIGDENLIADSAKIDESVLIMPVFIGENAQIKGSVIGPYTSIGSGSTITNSVVRSCLIQEKSVVSHVVLENSMLGNFVTYSGRAKDVSLGDFTTVKE